jgi:hypothetical protein
MPILGYKTFQDKLWWTSEVEDEWREVNYEEPRYL